MVEVFKTSVSDVLHADKLVLLIHQNFNDYQANFDLDDCDRILRIQTQSEPVDHLSIVSLLNRNGFIAEVLIDDFQGLPKANF